MRPSLPLLVLTTLLACGPTGEEQVLLTASPTTIDAKGEETRIVVTATDAAGKVGKGTVRVTSAAGSLTEGVDLPLDAYGRASLQFSCEATLDSHCKGTTRVVAEWKVGSKTVTGQVTVKIYTPPAALEYLVNWDDGGSPNRCGLPLNQQGTSCEGACPAGFTCIDGRCALNGGAGALQYTLRFPDDVDLDLHVVEPLTDGGTCEIYYGNPNRVPDALSCGARAALDLDSNPGCRIDSVNTENIIYPPNMPTFGTYTARVDYYASCSVQTPVPFELEVRAGSTSRYYCGSFTASQADHGGGGSGLTVSVINIPVQ